LLGKVNLTYVVEDDVLKITSVTHAKGNKVTKVYPVADLVIPVPDFGAPAPSDIWRSVDRATNNVPTQTAAASPYTGPGSLGTTGQSVGSSSGGSSFAATSKPNVSATGPTNTTQDQLMSLITNTIAKDTWVNQGGQGTIEYHPLTLSLVVGQQTPDIQDQI